MANSDFTTEELSNEIWVTLIDYPDYAVSNLGRVRRETKGMTVRAGRILKIHIRIRGFDRVNIFNQPAWYVHTLVAETFVEKPEYCTDIRHKDSNRLNNRVENLEWLSRRENQRHMAEFGNVAKGSRNAHAKLTEADIPIIFDLIESGKSLNAISRLFGVSGVIIANVRDGKNWSHVEVEGRTPCKRCPTCNQVIH